MEKVFWVGFLEKVFWGGLLEKGVLEKRGI